MFSHNFIKELQKLYPKIKIPFYKYQSYYLNCFLKDTAGYPNLTKTLSDLGVLEADLASTDQTISQYKMKMFDYIVQDIKNNGWVEQLNNLDIDKLFSNPFKSQDFSNWQTDKIYISVDINEANWSMFKKYILKKDFDLSWYDFVTNKYDLHPVIAASKSFRQFVLGNTNAKRLNKLGELSIQELSNKVLDSIPDLKMVMKNADEVIFEIKDDLYIFENILYIINSIPFDLSKKFVIFKVREEKNYEEFVRIKDIYENNLKLKKSELMGVPGNRFFLHYKTLILKENLDDKDLYFELDKKPAKWILPFTEERSIPTISSESSQICN